MSSKVSPADEVVAFKVADDGNTGQKQSLQRALTQVQAPTGKQLKLMSKEEREAWMETYLVEQRKQLANFDPDKIERDPMVANSEGAAITWKDVSFSIKIKDPEDPNGKRMVDKVLLEENNGHVPAGSLVAFMGPSGCGKSTLLDIIAGKKTTPYTGSVCINGHDMKTDPMSKRICAYVGQEDVMPQHWTVREAIEFNGRLKKQTPKEITKAQYDAMMDSLLEDVGLLHVAGTKIGGPSVRGLSGGQRRRVSLARGMAAGPNVMFCDEPTSGLSSTDAEACVKALKLIAKKWGVTILVVIHQPRVEVAMLFDQLVLLTSQPGRIVYNGPMKDANEYWAAVGYPVPSGSNPADHYLDLVTPGAPGAVPDVFRNYYIQNQKPKVLEAVAAAEAKQGKSPWELLEEEHELMKTFGKISPLRRSKFGVGFGTQFNLVLRRKIKLSLIDAEFLGTVIFMQIFIGVFIGVIYIDVGNKEPEGFSQIGFLFMFLNMAVMVPAFSMPSIITERTVMKIECSEALYSEWAHIISSSIVNAFFTLIGFIIMCVIMYACAILPWSSFGPTMYWALLNFVCMDAINSMAAAMAKNVEQANAILMPFQMLICLFNGLTLTKKSAPGFLKPFLYVSPLSLAMEGIAWDMYGDKQAVWDQLVYLNGYDKGNSALGAAICFGLAFLGRLGQVYALKTMHNISK